MAEYTLVIPAKAGIHDETIVVILRNSSYYPCALEEILPSHNYITAVSKPAREKTLYHKAQR